jgi:hypothetical protein
MIITDRALNALVTDSTNSAGRWFCQVSLSSTIVNLTENAYLDEIIETCILYFFRIGCCDLTVSSRIRKLSPETSSVYINVSTGSCSYL